MKIPYLLVYHRAMKSLAVSCVRFSWAMVGLIAFLSPVPTSRASVFIRELFDGATNNVSLHGQGTNLTSAVGFAPASNWVVNAGATMVTSNLLNIETTPALAGLLPMAGSAGSLCRNGVNNWATTIWATRALETNAQFSFAQSRVIYFSFRANNAGDTAVGMGFTSGNTNFIGVGAHWNNAGGGTANNSVYVSGGTLTTGNPYAIRANTAPGTLNGTGLIVGRLTLSSSGADTLSVKLYTAGSTIEASPASVTWSLSYTFTDTGITNMTATHLLLWLNGQDTAQLDAIRVGTTWADVTQSAGLIARELFDGVTNNVALAGQGTNLTSGIGFNPGGVWAANAGTISSANNFDVMAGAADSLPGLSPRGFSSGGLWNGGTSYGTDIWATRLLADTAMLNFAQDRVVYFSFRLDNAGDSAAGIGFASGSASSSAFLGVGAHWNNHTAVDGVSDANAIYITDGVLSQNLGGNNAGPYCSRAHTVAGIQNGTALIVGRLTLRASGTDTLEVKRYAAGDAMDLDPAAITWSLSYSITNASVTNMTATHLLAWINGTGQAQLDAIRVGTTWASVALQSGTFITELFDGATNNASLQGQGANLTTAAGFLAGSAWTDNNSAKSIKTESSDLTWGSPDMLPGLVPQAGSASRVFNGGSDYSRDRWATRPLEPEAEINFGRNDVFYFSYRLDNAGDTSVGVGFANGGTSAANYIGVGAHWNNAGGGTANNAIYVSGGTLSQTDGPYTIWGSTAPQAVDGPGLLVARLTANANGADLLQIKLYKAGDIIDSDQSAITWSLTYSITNSSLTNMFATHLLLWDNGGGVARLDGIRVGKEWFDVTGVRTNYPVIGQQPQSVQALCRSTAMFTATAGGPGPLFFQWYRNNSVITDATNTSLLVTNAAAAPGNYFVVVTNSYGAVTSSVAVLTIYADTTLPILTLPADMTVAATGAAGAVVTFATTASDDCSDGLSPTCWPASGSLFPVGASVVNCTVADGAGNRVYGAFRITVQDATQQSHRSIGFNFVGNGTALASGDWVGAPGFAQNYWNQLTTYSSAIAGAVPAVLRDSAGTVVPLTVGFLAAGTWANAANLATTDGKFMRGYLDSSTANTNLPKAEVQGIPYTNYSVVVYFDGDDNSRIATGPYWLETFSTVTNVLTPAVYGRDSSDFAMSYMQVPLSSTDSGSAVTGNYIVFTNLSSSEFRLRGSQVLGMTTRSIINGFQIMETAPPPPPVAPSIVAQPMSRTAVLGGNAGFHMEATGGLPLSYQWFKDGVPISGATTATLTLSEVSSNDIAGYTVAVTNLMGAVTSAPPATLSVVPALAPGADRVLITEFMASNTRTLADEDGDFSDWIEIYNAGTNTVNLLNWSLTDNAGKLNKWTFPSTNIAPGRFILVFASNKNRRTPGATLHTNFKLDANPPEFLALVRPDGSIASQFSSTFPAQFRDVSYGFGEELADITFVASNATVRYYVPTNSFVDATWTQAVFDDSAWPAGPQAFGFSSGATELVGLEALKTRLDFATPPVTPMVYDGSGWNHDGTGTNAIWMASAGARNGVMDFNAAVPSQIVVPPHNDFNSTIGTITFWVRSSGNTGPGSEGAIIFDRKNTGGDTIVIHDNGKLFVQPIGGRQFESASVITDGVWHHVAYVYNQAALISGGFTKIYIDGALNASSNSPTAWVWDTAQRIELGQSHNTYWKRLNGQLDEFCIYNRNLTDGEIASLAANTPVLDSSLKLRFSFDVAQGSAMLADTSPAASHPGFNSGTTYFGSSGGRNGVMQFTATPSNQVVIPPHTDFNSSTGTIAFWMKSAGLAGTGNEGAMLVDRRTGVGGDVIVQFSDGTLFVQTRNSSAMVNSFHTTRTVSDGSWHHVAYVYDQSAPGGISLYIDGTLDKSQANSATWSWDPNQRWELGRSHDAWWYRYDGLLDDFRIYNRQLSATEVSLLVSGEGQPANYAIGTDLGSLMRSNSASAYVRLPFTVDDPGQLTRLLLRVRYDDGFVASLNGTVVATRYAPSTPAWDSTATSRHSELMATTPEEITLPTQYLLAGSNLLTLQGLNRSTTDSTFLLQAEVTGTRVLQVGVEGRYFQVATPGALNGTGTADLGPVLSDVGHTPNVPGDTDSLLVTAQVAASFNPIFSVTLHYRVNFGTITDVAMFDDGAHGDGAAGDGVYGATISSALYVPNDMVRYYVTATDALGRASRWPLFGNPLDSPEYLGTVVADPALASSLPIFQLFVAPQHLAGIDTEGGGRASFFYDGEFYDNIYVEQRGGTTSAYTKKSHHLKFNHEHKLRHPGYASRIRDTSITTEFGDPSYLRQHLTFLLQTGSGGPAPFHYPVRLQRNGLFYQLGWHTDVLNDELLERLGYDPNGAFYKGVGQALPGSPEKKTRTWENSADYSAMAGAIRETNSLATRQTNFFERFDVPEVINYLAVARIVAENDDVWANMSLYRDSDGDGLWRIIPFDMNQSWGELFYADDTSINGSIQATNDANKSHPLYGGSTVYPRGTWNGYWNRIYDVVVQSPPLRAMLLRRMRTVMDTFLQAPGTAPASLVLENYLTTITNRIWAEAFLDRQTWGWPPNGGPYGYGPNLWLTNGVPDLVNQFINPRRAHLYVTHCETNPAQPIGIYYTNNAGIPFTQPANAAVTVVDLDFNPASANQAQEFLCLTNPNSFALDLTGWQLDGAVQFTFLAGTVIPSNSLLYVVKDKVSFRTRSSGPTGGQGLFVVGNYNGQLSARGESIRVKNDQGQPVSTNTYAGNPSLAQQYLRITEVMYHPQVGAPYDQEDYEFIELKNISGTETLELNGIHFTNGVEFAFTVSTSLAPGQRLLLVKNQAAFEFRYGSGLPIGGTYVGSLDNAGERLTLLDAVNEEVLDFTYNNSWYPITDGLGFSLAVVNENAEPDTWNNKSQWRPSGAVNGSPGADDTAPAFAPVVINEVLSASGGTNVDAIELYNPASTNVDVGGWFLTDAYFTPKKFRIPDGTTIPAGGYVVFTEAEFNVGVNAFAFNSSGDDACLFSGDAGGNLTGYSQGFSFGTADTNVTFGRYVTSVGEEHFVAQSASTLGATNAYPQVGPLAITEIMYHPPDVGTNDNQLHEFVELQNISGADLALFDPAQPTNTWRIRGGVDYEFPTNVTLSARSNVLVVSFDPGADPANAASFRTHYGLSVDVPLFGPYRGKLNNNEDTIEVQKPSALTNTPYILVEKVHYYDTTPWPAAADGAGQSLRRLHLADYANDPVNWAAAVPTPSVGSFQITGQVQLEAFTGPNRDGNGQRTVTFAVTDGVSFTNRFDQTLSFIGGLASYTLSEMQPGTTRISAKTEWNLRKQASVIRSNGAAMVNFIDSKALPAGDLDGSNVVDVGDYFILAGAWYQAVIAADLDGSGIVDLDDFFLMANHWNETGEGE